MSIARDKELKYSVHAISDRQIRDVRHVSQAVTSSRECLSTFYFLRTSAWLLMVMITEVFTRLPLLWLMENSLSTKF